MEKVNTTTTTATSISSEAKFVNLSGGHDINLYKEEDCTPNQFGKLVRNPGAQPYSTIPLSGCVRAERKVEVVKTKTHAGVTVQYRKVDYGKPTGLPEVLEDGVDYIVSFIALCAIRQHYPEIAHRFVLVDGAVVDETGHQCGCTGVSVG